MFRRTLAVEGPGWTRELVSIVEIAYRASLCELMLNNVRTGNRASISRRVVLHGENRGKLGGTERKS